MFGIMSEFVEATERLAEIRPAVSIFGSARARADSPVLHAGRRYRAALSDAGFSVISGGGPGIMEAANKGAVLRQIAFGGPEHPVAARAITNRFQDISHTFHHFFARKVSFVKFAIAYVVMPGGFGTLDELSEALTLVQTGKTRRMPIILVHSPFWQGLLDWFRESMQKELMIGPEDLDLVQMIDDPAAIVEAIFKYYEKRGFAPLPAKRENLLNL